MMQRKVTTHTSLHVVDCRSLVLSPLLVMTASITLLSYFMKHLWAWMFDL